jgi:DASS family divalent anion:Na+ symporter
MTSVYQCDVIVCAMFLTGQASNPLIAKFAQQVTGIEVTYARWILASIIPAVASLILVPFVIYKIYPPEIKHTPAASELLQKNSD